MSDTRVLRPSEDSACPFAKPLALRVKRALDVVLGSVLVALCLPLMGVIAAAVTLDGGPVFYRGERVGANGRIFRPLRFRTMIPDAEPCLQEYLEHHPAAREEWEREGRLAFDPRLTAIGKALRRAGLDRLPQLVDVVRGDMSLVGPRPVTPNELREQYSPTSAALYKSMRPGMTGLWQVRMTGVDDQETNPILRDDGYVRDWTLGRDLSILRHAPAVVLSGRASR